MQAIIISNYREVQGHLAVVVADLSRLLYLKVARLIIIGPDAPRGLAPNTALRLLRCE